MSPGLAVFIAFAVYASLLVLAGVFLPFRGLLVVIFTPAIIGAFYYIFFKRKD